MVLLCEAVHRYSPLASALGEGGGEHFLDRIWEVCWHGISFEEAKIR
jgi:hypothetical protein